MISSCLSPAISDSRRQARTFYFQKQSTSRQLTMSFCVLVCGSTLHLFTDHHASSLSASRLPAAAELQLPTFLIEEPEDNAKASCWLTSFYKHVFNVGYNPFYCILNVVAVPILAEDSHTARVTLKFMLSTYLMNV